MDWKLNKERLLNQLGCRFSWYPDASLLKDAAKNDAFAKLSPSKQARCRIGGGCRRI